MSKEADKGKKANALFVRIIDKCKEAYEYADTGVWKTTRNTMWVRIVKICSLSVRTFFNRDLQTRAMAMTYITVLAIVPAFALLFAIARGFGFQNIIQDQLFNFIPSQKKALETGITFVDSYLKQASQGVFVGVGIIVLLWTLISLLSNMEEAFNNIWGIKKSRTFYRKITDYLTAIILLPILMVLSSSISIFISGINDALNLDVLTPMVNFLLDFTPFILTWLAFTLTFTLMPNTKVNFGYAVVAGFLCMIGFQVIQYLFLTGQLYVSKYNAIYGSFAFLPLLLVWLQLSWLIILFGCLLTYSMQNVTGFNYMGTTEDVAPSYMKKISFIIGAIIFHRQKMSLPPIGVPELAAEYKLPVSLVNAVVERMYSAGVVYYVAATKNCSEGLVPAVDPVKFTVSDYFRMMADEGDEGFIPNFSVDYKSALHQLESIQLSSISAGNLHLMRDVVITI